jgi:hypothetical protein
VFFFFFFLPAPDAACWGVSVYTEMKGRGREMLKCHHIARRNKICRYLDRICCLLARWNMF